MSWMIPSIRKHSVVIPVPIKRNRGPCNTDDFRGISLVSVPCIQGNVHDTEKRLALVVEERKLVAEEQGGFRKRRSRM